MPRGHSAARACVNDGDGVPRMTTVSGPAHCSHVLALMEQVFPAPSALLLLVGAAWQTA